MCLVRNDGAVPCDIGRDDRSSRRHRLYQDDAHAFIAEGRAAEDVSRPIVARQILIGDVTDEMDILKSPFADDPRALPVHAPRSYDQQPAIRELPPHLRISPQHVREPFALLHAALKQDVELPVLVRGHRRRVRVLVRVDAVRDDRVVAREVAIGELSRGLRNGDALIQPPRPSLQPETRQPQRAPSLRVRMERTDHCRAGRQTQERQWKGRGHWLMQMHDVEIALLQQGSHMFAQG